MQNISSFDIFSATKEVVQSHNSEPPTAGLIEGVSGAAVGIVFIIGLIVAMRKNLEAVQVVLEQLREILTITLSAMRKRLTANPPPPPNEPGQRNYTDDQIIEMRRQMDAHIEDETDYGASQSVWI